MNRLKKISALESSKKEYGGQFANNEYSITGDMKVGGNYIKVEQFSVFAKSKNDAERKAKYELSQEYPNIQKLNIQASEVKSIYKYDQQGRIMNEGGNTRKLSEQYSERIAKKQAKKDISKEYFKQGDPFDFTKPSEQWTRYALPEDTKFYFSGEGQSEQQDVASATNMMRSRIMEGRYDKGGEMDWHDIQLREERFESIMKYLNIPESEWENYRKDFFAKGGNVTTMPIIARITTKPLKYTIQHLGDVEENEMPSSIYDIVAIEDWKMANGSTQKVYITNQWYKEHKQIPLVIVERLVDKVEMLKKGGKTKTNGWIDDAEDLRKNEIIIAIGTEKNLQDIVKNKQDWEKEQNSYDIRPSKVHKGKYILVEEWQGFYLKNGGEIDNKEYEKRIKSANYYLQDSIDAQEKAKGHIDEAERELRQAKQSTELAKDELEGKPLPFAEGGTIKVKTPRKEHTIEVGDISVDEATKKVRKEYPTFKEFEYKRIRYVKTGKKGEFLRRIEPQDILDARWDKKKSRIRQLSDNIRSLRNNVSRDLKSDDEKTFLCALIVAIMDKTGERVGNDDSADNGHYGVTGFRKKHISVKGTQVNFDYVGKSGVKHEKMFSDFNISKALNKAIKKSPNYFVFTTSKGQRIRANQINEYLSKFGITAKDIRGYSANKWMLDKLKEVKPEDTEKKRKKQFNQILKYVAANIGHGTATLRKHYLMPEVGEYWINDGKLFDIKKAGYVLKKGGNIKTPKKMKIGGMYEHYDEDKAIQRQYEEELKKGVKVEKEHKDLYRKLKRRLLAQGVQMPMSEQEFYENIAKAHLKEDKDYYDLLMKYVEKKKTKGGELKDAEKELIGTKYQHSIQGMTRTAAVATIHFISEIESIDKGMVTLKVIHSFDEDYDRNGTKNTFHAKYLLRDVEKPFNQGEYVIAPNQDREKIKNDLRIVAEQPKEHSKGGKLNELDRYLMIDSIVHWFKFKQEEVEKWSDDKLIQWSNKANKGIAKGIKFAKGGKAGVRTIIFTNKVNRNVEIEIQVQGGRIIDIENPQNFRFPFHKGQMFQMNVQEWARVNGWLMDGKDLSREEKIFGVRVSDVPKGHEWRMIYPHKFRKEDGGNLPKIYALKTIGYKGATPQVSFHFNANNLEDAISKAKGWGRYHSFIYERDYIVEEYKGEPLFLHNEYIKSNKQGGHIESESLEKDYLQEQPELLLEQGGSASEDIITKYQLWGKGIPVKFKGNPKTYYTKNIGADRRTIFVTNEQGIVRSNRIANISFIYNKPVRFSEGGEIVTSDGTRGGMAEGPAHSEGGIQTNVIGGHQVEIEGGEPIIVPKVMQMKEKIRCIGTPKGIASSVNQIGGGAKFAKDHEGSCEYVGVEKSKKGKRIDKLNNLIVKVSPKNGKIDVPAGSSIINKTNMKIKKKMECEGTPGGVASAINEHGGNGVKFADNGQCRIIEE